MFLPRPLVSPCTLGDPIKPSSAAAFFTIRLKDSPNTISSVQRFYSSHPVLYSISRPGESEACWHSNSLHSSIWLLCVDITATIVSKLKKLASLYPTKRSFAENWYRKLKPQLKTK